MKYIFILLAFLGGYSLGAQSANDSLSPEKNTASTYVHSPKKASIYSLVLPGAGQVYNRKYWKVPVVYGLLGGAGYGFYTFNKELKVTNDEFRSLYSQGKAPTPLQIDDRNTLRNRRDLAGISFVLVYVLQVVDATVDAHFYKFDINQKLSVGMSPENGQFIQLTYQISGK